MGTHSARRAVLAATVILSALPLLVARPAVAAGDGTVLAWGGDIFGQLGDGGPADDGGYQNQSTPVPVRGLGAGSGVVSVAAGGTHNLALRADGSVMAWGNDSLGQLGDGPGRSQDGNQATPVEVTGLGPGGVIAAAAGHDQSLALRPDGTVLSWGAGLQHTPTEVPGLGAGSGVVAVAAGGQNLALRSDGTVFAWVRHKPGPVVYPPGGVDGTPVPVIGLEAGSGVVAVSAGVEHNLAVRGDGSVLAWGKDDRGQLGDDDAVTVRANPGPVRGLGPGSGVVAVSAGLHHSLAVRRDTSVVAWGGDESGQLGDGGGAGPDRRTPTAVSGLGPGSGVVAVSAGWRHSLAIKADGSVLAWGWDYFRQVGDGGSNTDQPAPVAVSGLGAGSGVKAVAAGALHSLALKSSLDPASTFAPVSPARLWDTRAGPGSVGRMGPGGVRHLAVTGVGGLPAAGVTAVVLNVTAVSPTSGTFVTVWPAGEARPTASNLNVPAGDSRPNLVTVKVGAFGQVSFFNASGSVDLVVDVAGWYGPTAGQRYEAVSPARLWDSRLDPAPAGRVGPAATKAVAVTGVGGVPEGASAVLLNVTAVNPSDPTFVTAWPTGEPRPLASNLNIRPGGTNANLVLVKVGAGGQVSLFNESGAVDLVVDVSGYFGTAGSSLTSATPTRLWDTRAGPGPRGRLGPGAIRSVPVTGTAGVPAIGVTAVILNLTAVSPTASTYVTAWPTGEPQPLASNLNLPAGDTRANLVTVKVGTDGQVSFFSSAGTVDLVADVAGWYGLSVPEPPPPPPPLIADAPVGSATSHQVNARHDGSAAGALDLPTPAVPKWSRHFDQEGEYPPRIEYALKVGDRVFVTVRRFMSTHPDGLHYGVDLYALDAGTGGTLWGPINLGDFTRDATVAADSQNVYVRKAYDLSSYDQATGQRRWSTELRGNNASAPVVAGGLVYVDGFEMSGWLAAVDGRTGAIIWETALGASEGVAVAGGEVYAGGGRYEALGGGRVWSAGSPGRIDQPPVVHGDSVYANAPDGRRNRLSRSTGALLGSTPALWPPAFSGELGFFLAPSPAAPNTMTLSAVNQRTGAVAWTANGDGRLFTAPIAVDGRVVVGSQSGLVTVFDEQTGAQVWVAGAGAEIAGLGNGGSQLVGLNVADGLLLVPADDNLVAFDGGGGA